MSAIINIIDIINGNIYRILFIPFSNTNNFVFLSLVCFSKASTATTVTQTRHNVTFYAHYISCSLLCIFFDTILVEEIIEIASFLRNFHRVFPWVLVHIGL